ncbi:MAG: hypothetical protein FJ100_22975 [Deltaproteobacteria bacterium]|nr:hypothetical protein [Deltaproteobacteria bacterium]
MDRHALALRCIVALALGLASACTVNPVPTPAKTAGVGVQGTEDNNGVPTGLADASDPGKADNSSDATQMGAAADAAPPAADATGAQDGVGDSAAADGGRGVKD